MAGTAPPEGQVVFEIRDGIAIITMDRPSRRNALGAHMWALVAARIDEASRQRVRALILTATGDHFCAGMDLKPDNPLAGRAVQAIVDGDPAAARALIEELKGVGARLRRFPAPTIAAIEGSCLGGGLELALHCDIRIASATARLGMPEVRIGMVPDVGGTALLARLVGPARAIALVCSGRVVDAQRAFDLGFIEELAPAGEALAAAIALAADISKGGPTAVRAALAVLRDSAGRSVNDVLAMETDAGVAALVSGEPMEGLQAFAEKRDPRW